MISGDTLDYRNGKLLTCSGVSGNPFNIYDVNNMKLLHQIKSDVSNDFECFSGRFSPQKGDYTVFSGSSNPNSLRIFEEINKTYK